MNSLEHSFLSTWALGGILFDDCDDHDVDDVRNISYFVESCTCMSCVKYVAFQKVNIDES